MKSSGVHPEIRNKEEWEDHSPISPSGISAIIKCPGKVKLCEGLEDKTSFAAAQGTVAHEICEQKLKGKRFPVIGSVKVQDGHEVEVDKEMIDAVKVYVKHIAGIKESIDSELNYEEAIEVKDSLEWCDIPECYGTSDYSLSVPFHTLYIRDYKHGVGVTVSAERNEQLMVYALIAGQELFETYDKINIGIVQPRTRDGNPIKTWETTPEEIINWGNNSLKPAIELAMSDDAPLNPGEKQCMWCRGKAICPALAKQALQVAQEDFKDFSDIKPDAVVDSVSIEKVAQVYEQLPLLKSFIKAIEARVFNTLALGEKVNGYKLVKGRRSRSWTDETRMAITLTDMGLEPFEKKLLSPAKAEKLLTKDKKKEVQSFISVSEGKPSIVKSSDKRVAITTAADDFAVFKN
jgi:hypothetical protein